MMKLVAVTVHFGNPEATARLIDRLVNYDIISSVVAVLHDNLYAPRENPRVSYLREENRGYAAGLNLAVRHLLETMVDSDLILALNPDIKIEESQILDLMDAHITAEADCSFPAIVEKNKVIHGYRLSWAGTVRQVRNHADFFPGTCFLFSLHAWKQVGGFNEDYFHYFEDADFCFRLRREGLRIHHVPDVVVEHQGKSGADYPATYLPHYAVRNHLLFLKTLGKLNPLSFGNVTVRQLLYLFRWEKGWRGVPQWFSGIRAYLARAKSV